MRRTIRRSVALLLLLAALIWSWKGIDFDSSLLQNKLSFVGEFIQQMFPPNWSLLPKAWKSLVVTIQMSILGTFFGFVLALPVSFLAARTTAIPRPISSGIKTVLNILRAVPTIIYAVVLILIVGLGPLPGALSIGLSSFIMLAKLFAESLESVHPAPIEAVKAVGGSPLQVFAYGMLPQVLPQFLSHTLYAWELNISAATVVGIVGAGGIGSELKAEMGYFAWRNVSVYILLLVGKVLVADMVSYQIRKRYT